MNTSIYFFAIVYIIMAMINFKKNGLSVFRILRNIYSPIVFFVVLYFLFNNLFMITILSPAVYISNKIPFELFMKDYLSESLYYIYPITLLSATFNMLLLAALRLYRRNGAVISILLFTILLSAYPVITILKGDIYKLDFRKYKVGKIMVDSNVMNGTKLKNGYLTTVNNYSVYVQDSFTAYSYKNVLLNRVGVSGPVYIADTMSVEDNELQLRNVLIIDNLKSEIKNVEGLNVKFNEDIKDSFHKSMSGVHILEPVNAMMYKFLYNENTLYSFLLFFCSLFLFLLSSYMLMASISIPMHILHNVLAVILFYYIFVVSFYFISKLYNIDSLISSNSILTLSLFVLAYDVVAMVLAVILRAVFNFNRYYFVEKN